MFATPLGTLLGRLSLRARLFGILLVISLALLSIGSSCRKPIEPKTVAPRLLRDVPAVRLAYKFIADTGGPKEEIDQNSALIVADFNTRRKEERLVRTVASPDSQRLLALYETRNERSGEFRIDMYAADGKFLRNITPDSLSCVYAPVVAWSPDGSTIAFIGRKSFPTEPTTSPLDLEPDLPLAPQASPTVAPVFAPVQVFATEQIYVCNRDGFELKPLTTRDGLIYFFLSWAPDGHAIVSLACKEDEWTLREKERRQPAGRPRIIDLSGRERLLDDELASALPVWSPDSAKVAAGFETEVGIYDAMTGSPTSARIPLNDALLVASRDYDANSSKKAGSVPNVDAEPQASPAQIETPASFNPIVRLQWIEPETLFVQTGFIRLYDPEVRSFMRWHRIVVTSQATKL